MRKVNIYLTGTSKTSVTVGTKKNTIIQSPLFVVDTLKNVAETKWMLCVKPSGERNSNFIGCYLHFVDHGGDVETVKIGLTLECLAANGSTLKSWDLGQHTFRKGESWGMREFLSKNCIFKVRKDEFLNTFGVRCRMRKTDDTVLENGHCIARSSIDVESRSFIWNIKDFSKIEPDKKITFTIKSISKENLVTLDLYVFGGQCFDEWINIDIKTHTQSVKYFTIKTHLLNSDGNMLNCVPQEFWNDRPCKIGTCTLSSPKRELIENKSLYLPNDVLSLQCECSFSTGEISEKIEFIGYDCNSSPNRKATACNRISIQQNNLPRNPGLLVDDLEVVYKDGVLSDTKLRTKTEILPVHKIVLSSRSPVFRAMFTVDMKEKATNYVDIPDMDAITIRQMLLYMYTDKVDFISLENASLLYEAADKYGIISLKNKCSSFLKNSLSPTMACEVLVLADMHQDTDFKKDVQEYILKQNQIIFKSSEWERFMTEHCKLAAETMFLIWKKDTSLVVSETSRQLEDTKPLEDAN